jgi:SsrA-binding protein
MNTKTPILIKNKKASFEYHFIDTFVAGICLSGTEIKSIREGKASLAEAYCTIISGELFVKNMHIAEYSHGNYNNHVPKRMRKLLLNRKELNKLESALKDKGVTIIPVKLFINDRGFAKLEIALARGKKLYDKREDLKKKDAAREMLSV